MGGMLNQTPYRGSYMNLAELPTANRRVFGGMLDKVLHYRGACQAFGGTCDGPHAENAQHDQMMADQAAEARPRQRVTRDMAIDAGDLSLGGSLL